MYLPTTFLPPEHNIQAPVMLRFYVTSIISSLIKKGFQLCGMEGENCKTMMSKMTAVMNLLESAKRGDLDCFEKEQHLTVKDSCGIPKESQDESWVSRYLNHS